MRISKKKKTSVRITRPYAPQARTLTFHRNDDLFNPTNSTTYAVVSAASEALGMLPSQPLEPNDSYIANQSTMEHDEPEEKKKSKERKRTMALEEWLMYRDIYLQELLRHDGREGEPITFCAYCGNSGDFSCYDCAYCMHYCQDCLVDRHRLMPLHRIKV
jgi:hypothetical protein